MSLGFMVAKVYTHKARTAHFFGAAIELGTGTKRTKNL